MELIKIAILSFLIFLFLLFIFYLYTQFFVEKKTITIVNADGKEIKINVEIAADPFKQARGLMFRDKLGENEGMLFVFNKPAKYGFWMVNTTIPLDAIFFDENKRVVDIIKMEPCRTMADYCKVYAPKAEAKYVLEVNQGFAEKNKIIDNCTFRENE